MNNSENAKQFTRLWTSAQPAVAAFVSSMVPDYNEADDVLQQVSVTLLDKFHQYDPKRPFIAWAIGVAKLEILSHRRKSSHDRHIFDSEALERVADAFEELEPKLGRIGESLAMCMRLLKGRPRDAFELRYGRDMKPADIGKQLSMTPNAVGVLLHRARTSLRKCIEQRLKVVENQ
jgi:RNA polymerase sigma-70 factor (ECF subfamily)